MSNRFTIWRALLLVAACFGFLFIVAKIAQSFVNVVLLGE